MINEKMQKAINEQINHEMYSSYLYLSMSADLANKGFEGMSAWMMIQSGEETAHAMKFYNFLLDRGGKVELLAIEKPRIEWSNPQEIYEEALKHEQFITSKINDLFKLAQEVNDYPSLSLLQWFIDEQVEEEATADKIVGMLKMVGNNGNGIFMIDRELGKRTITTTQTQ